MMNEGNLLLPFPHSCHRFLATPSPSFLYMQNFPGYLFILHNRILALWLRSNTSNDLMRKNSTAGNVTLCFTHYGAPSHFIRDGEQFMGPHYPDWCIWQNELVLWPPWPPGFTPAEFYLGAIWRAQFTWRVNMQDTLWHLIQTAAARIQLMPGIFQCTSYSWHHRTQLCIHTNGQHFQQIL